MLLGLLSLCSAHLLRPPAPAMHRSNVRTGLMRRTEGSLAAPPGSMRTSGVGAVAGEKSSTH